MRRHSLVIDCGIILSLIILNLLVIAPFLTLDFSSEPWNNDYTYIGMSRMFHDRPWSWNSLQYGGAPFRYLYPPLFHLLVLAMPVASLGRAYHLASSIGYALVPAAFYVAALQLFRSRWLAAALSALQSFSPTVLYYLLPGFGAFAGKYRHGPANFVALIASNESAHTLSLALVLLVVAAAWRNRWLAASLLSAAVFLLNWAGIIGLLIVLTAVAVASSRELGYGQTALRMLGVAGIAYGLAAFWVSPDCIFTTRLLDRVVLRHIQPSTPFNAITAVVVAGGVIVLAVSMWPRIPKHIAFTLALLAISGAVVISYDRTGNYLLPLPHRYIQEFNIGLILALGCMVAALWKWRRSVAVLILAISAVPAVPFLAGAWKVQQRGADPHSTLAFQISDWLSHHADSARILVTGELEGTLNIWSNVPQAGGSAQGVSNYLVPAAHRQITFGCQADATRLAELWLHALDIRYLVVHGPASAEHFHWFVAPERFARWPAVWNDGAGDIIYRVPPSDDQQAVIVSLDQMRQLPALHATDDARFLEAYVVWAHGIRPVQIHWSAPDHAELHADTRADEAVLVKVNHDAGWMLSVGAIGRDPIGFLLVKPTKDAVSLQWKAPWPVWLGRAITALTILLLLLRVPPAITGVAALLPAITAFVILQLNVPSTAKIAEQAYARLQPPLINPGAIVDGVSFQPPPLKRGSVISLFGSNFGTPADRVQVWINQQNAEVLYRGAYQINLRLPLDTPSTADISVDVNGCRGNSYAISIR